MHLYGKRLGKNMLLGCRGLNISPFFLYGLAFLYPCLCFAIFGLHEVSKKRALRWTLMPALFCTTWASRVAAASKFTLHFYLSLWLCWRDMLTFRVSLLLVIYFLRSLAFRALYDVRGHGIGSRAFGCFEFNYFDFGLIEVSYKMKSAVGEALDPP